MIPPSGYYGRTEDGVCHLMNEGGSYFGTMCGLKTVHSFHPLVDEFSPLTQRRRASVGRYFFVCFPDTGRIKGFCPDCEAALIAEAVAEAMLKE